MADSSEVEDVLSGECKDDLASSSTFTNDLIIRTRALLVELEAFQDRLRTLQQDDNFKITSLRGQVRSELKMMEKLSQKPKSESTMNVARSSNLPFYEYVWTVAKNSKDLVNLQKRLLWDTNDERRFRSMASHERNVNDFRRKKSKEKSYDNTVTIDVIADSGRTWKKVSLVSNTRLIFDLAKQGWESDGSDLEDCSDGSAKYAVDGDSDIPLIRTCKQLMKASNLFRVRTKRAVVQLILPRVVRGQSPEVDQILRVCEDYGAVIICNVPPPPNINHAMPIMARDPVLDFSETLNIDCTILLALVSDFSHANVSKEPWFHPALQRQVEIESNENLLTSSLYPVLGSHRLSCTKEAAKRMREIVDTIGTPSEVARTALFIAQDSSKTQTELLDEMQRLSAYTVPADLQIPIEVVDQNQGDCQSNLHSAAKQLSTEMSLLNQSVFLHGWATGKTTITSNRVVVKKIESDLEEFNDLDDTVWPSIWLCQTARSLVGKEKRGASRKDEGRVMRLPDPLRREHQRRNGLDVLTIRDGSVAEDFRPNGHPCEEVISAKMEALQVLEKVQCSKDPNVNGDAAPMQEGP